MNFETLRCIEKSDLPLSDSEIMEIIEQIETQIIGGELASLNKLSLIYLDESCTQPELKPINGFFGIILTGNFRGDGERTQYQLSHELVHLIAPVSRAEVIYFEEGLAIYFSLDFVKSKGLKAKGNIPYYERAIEIMDEKYKQAYTDILQLEELADKSIYEICKHLISNNLIESFAEITPEILSKEFDIKDNEEVLQRLCSKFY